MAKHARLKVFRLPIGFHDAYIAAASQKAALTAWGAQADLFARGLAERVEDPELMREPLANPGKVIRRLRGTSAEQIAALAPDPAADDGIDAITIKSEPARPDSKPRPPKPKPPPDRSGLDAAERELAGLENRQRAERDALAQRQAELDRERHALKAAQQEETRKTAHALDSARAAYDGAMRKWRG